MTVNSVDRSGYITWLIISGCFPGLLQSNDRAPLFSQLVYPMLKRQGCHTCHRKNGEGSDTRVSFPSDSASLDEIEDFGRSLVAVIDSENPGESPLINKATNRVPHSAGSFVIPGSQNDEVLRSRVNSVAQEKSAETKRKRNHRTPRKRVVGPQF